MPTVARVRPAEARSQELAPSGAWEEPMDLRRHSLPPRKTEPKSGSELDLRHFQQGQGLPLFWTWSRGIHGNRAQGFLQEQCQANYCRCHFGCHLLTRTANRYFSLGFWGGILESLSQSLSCANNHDSERVTSTIQGGKTLKQQQIYHFPTKMNLVIHKILWKQQP